MTVAHGLGAEPAQAATRPIYDSNAKVAATYDDQDPTTIPWSTVIQESPSTRFGQVNANVDNMPSPSLITSPTTNWGTPSVIVVWDIDKQTNYRHVFNSLSRPYPFRNSASVATELGQWSYVSQSEHFSLFWKPAPGYIGMSLSLIHI